MAHRLVVFVEVAHVPDSHNYQLSYISRANKYCYRNGPWWVADCVGWWRYTPQHECDRKHAINYSVDTWTLSLRCRKTELFQQLVKTNDKENINGLHYPLWGESTGDAPQNESVLRKMCPCHELHVNIQSLTHRGLMPYIQWIMPSLFHIMACHQFGTNLSSELIVVCSNLQPKTWIKKYRCNMATNLFYT